MKYIITFLLALLVFSADAQKGKNSDLSGSFNRDNDPVNEIQTLSFLNGVLSLNPNGGSVTIPDNIDDADADPTNEIQTLTLTNEQRLVPVGYANVNADGSIAGQFGGVTVNRTGTGAYTLTPPAGALTSVFTVVEDEPTRDDMQLSKEDFIGNQIHISEQDNGGGAGVYRDQPFTVIYYGLQNQLSNVTISN